MNNSSPKTVDTLIHAQWIIPIRPAKTQLQQHSLAIKDGIIVDLLPTELAKQQYCSADTQELEQHLLMPGLVNAHGHAAMSLFRGMADDQELHTWLQDHIWPAEAQWISDEFVKDGSLLAIAEMLRSGTTCYSDMYFFPDAAAEAVLNSGIRAQFCFPVLDFPSAWGRDADDYISKGLAARDKWQHHQLLDFAFGPHAPYTVSDEPFIRIATLAAELDIGIQIHCHETQQEVDDALAKDGERPLARLNRLGLLGPSTQLVHMTALNHADIELVRQSGAHVVHCPASNLKLASGFCPTHQLMEHNINVALGTDGAASNNNLDLFSEMHTAALLAKAVSGNAAAVSDWQALEMATLAGAKALGLQHKIGSLEAGKQADFIAIDMSNIEQQPIYQPISQMVYTHNASNVQHSWVAGQQVLRNRQPTQINLARLVQKAQQWRDKIQPTQP
ncbi:TRZ/ATZ family hydrolase [Dasania sp. GY-MA-18]|uniref:TRZ/ATZ family hydrolase n=1 Tax=Dasania phycosphaerae TaxID=2950436 RepID=A0A9J6RR11_9GAMM|nr:MULTISPECIES: TRZ/ATZ family hydrolase [Dasania]MCR8924255.1 TRZ/ATZ family hydrolase [Dasania sp. GY-MA-18]MCZ0866908.1 TRZ/ATZ family hydrolase [Dasania phycosphaerae]MCZ0870412.1 TRZ/ATZ family hydrolase [Dasania phycosphaerae]